MRTFRLKNLGCKVNQYEGDAVAQMLSSAGLRRADEGPADLVIINTCTVTASASAKGRKMIRAERRASPGAKLVVTGCMAGHEPAGLGGMAEIDLVVPNVDKGRLLALLGLGRDEFSQKDLALEGPPERTRAFVRVQDGCEQRCAYCIIPHVRGPEWSRAAGTVLDEIRHLVDAGVGEVVLCGIHLGRYGVGLGPKDCLTDLVERIMDLPGEFRLRLSSIEIGEVTSRLAEMAAPGTRLARHLHLPLQSGSDAVLAAMGRPCTRGLFLDRLEGFRRIAGDLGITTDIMAGFPGEAESDFAETISCLEEMRPHRVHRFAFSPREGTPAASMGDAAPRRVVAERMARLAEVSERLAADYAEARIGAELEVLCEPGATPGSVEGYSSEYLRVRLEPSAGAGAVGRMLRVTPCRREGGLLVGPAAEFS